MKKGVTVRELSMVKFKTWEEEFTYLADELRNTLIVLSEGFKVKKQGKELRRGRETRHLLSQSQ